MAKTKKSGGNPAAPKAAEGGAETGIGGGEVMGNGKSTVAAPAKDTERGVTELEKLKNLWRGGVAAGERARWERVLNRRQSMAVIRAKLRKGLKVNLRRDRDLARFRAWAVDFKGTEQEQVRMMADQTQLEKELAGLSMDEVRERVLRRAYERVLGEGDYEFGLRTVRAHNSYTFLQLRKEMMEFDAAEAIRRVYPRVRLIQQDGMLSEREKINRIRQELFGILPEEKPAP